MFVQPHFPDQAHIKTYRLIYKDILQVVLVFEFEIVLIKAKKIAPV